MEGDIFVRFLLQHGLSPNNVPRNPDDCNSLLLAIQRESPQMIELLLQYLADFNSQDNNRDGLSRALEELAVGTMKLLLTSNPKKSAKIRALLKSLSSKDSSEISDLLLNNLFATESLTADDINQILRTQIPTLEVQEQIVTKGIPILEAFYNYWIRYPSSNNSNTSLLLPSNGSNNNNNNNNHIQQTITTSPTSTNNNIGILPVDILLVIWSLLDINTILRCGSVCRAWRSYTRHVPVTISTSSLCNLLNISFRFERVVSISLSTYSRLVPSIIQRSVVNVHTLKLDIPNERQFNIQLYATQLAKLEHLHIQYFDGNTSTDVDQLLERFPKLTSLISIQWGTSRSIEDIPPLPCVTSPVLTKLSLMGKYSSDTIKISSPLETLLFKHLHLPGNTKFSIHLDHPQKLRELNISFPFYHWKSFLQQCNQLTRITCNDHICLQELLEYLPTTVTHLAIRYNPIDIWFFEASPKLHVSHLRIYGNFQPPQSLFSLVFPRLSTLILHPSVNSILRGLQSITTTTHNNNNPTINENDNDRNSSSSNSGASSPHPLFHTLRELHLLQFEQHTATCGFEVVVETLKRYTNIRTLVLGDMRRDDLLGILAYWKSMGEQYITHLSIVGFSIFESGFDLSIALPSLIALELNVPLETVTIEEETNQLKELVINRSRSTPMVIINGSCSTLQTFRISPPDSTITSRYPLTALHSFVHYTIM